MKIAGYSVTPKQAAALHGLYRGLVTTKNGSPTVYGVNVRKQLDALADKGVIARTSFSYMIPFDSPGAAIIDATPDYALADNL